MRQQYSIRDLVPSPDPALRSPNQESRSHTAAQAALRRKYHSFSAEVSLQADILIDQIPIHIQGRIDGIRRVKGGFCLYEIKPVTGNPARWKNLPELQQARWQLILYCDLFRLSNPRDERHSISNAVLYLIGDDGRTCEEEINPAQTIGSLEKRLRVLLVEQSAATHRFRSLNLISSFIRDDRAVDRPIQSDAETAIQALNDPDRVLLALPPGAGKTRIALRYALQQSARFQLPIYWITAKAEGRQTIIDELDRYNEHRIDISYCWKTTAERVCSCDSKDQSCDIRYRTRDALFFGDTVSSFADADICPHELNRKLEQKSNVVIADLNYLLTGSSLNRHSAILILDEVQHFVNRIIEHFRITISTHELRSLLRRLPASRRSAYNDLLRPEWIDDELQNDNPNLWTSLASDFLLHRIEEEAADKVTLISRQLELDPASYRLVWYNKYGHTGWCGSIIQPDSFIDSLLQRFPSVIALSGSLPSDTDGIRTILPGFSDFNRISPKTNSQAVTALVPHLDFHFPVRQIDIQDAVTDLSQIYNEYGGTVAAFTQNRESAFIIGDALRVRGFTSLIDQDVSTDWQITSDMKPDFLLITLGGNLAESVNPPQNLFSCAVILAAGHRPPNEINALIADEFSEDEDVFRTDSEYLQSVRQCASRVIQAAGRVQRSPDSAAPVFLLNRAFLRPEFMHLWPRSWSSGSLTDITFNTLDEALVELRTRLSHLPKPSSLTGA
jgi:hypothetical protein